MLIFGLCFWLATIPRISQGRGIKICSVFLPASDKDSYDLCTLFREQQRNLDIQCDRCLEWLPVSSDIIHIYLSRGRKRRKDRFSLSHPPFLYFSPQCQVWKIRIPLSLSLVVCNKFNHFLAMWNYIIIVTLRSAMSCDALTIQSLHS